MKARCYRKSHKWYKRYGGRGITICDEWRNSFEAFKDWALANGYKDDLTIERIDNDKGYSPNNCCWASQRTQISNRSNTRKYEFDGKTQTLSLWAEEIGIPYGTLYRRMFTLEWDIKKTLTTPLGKGGKNYDR
jgi:hypothetical protein